MRVFIYICIMCLLEKIIIISGIIAAFCSKNTARAPLVHLYLASSSVASFRLHFHLTHHLWLRPQIHAKPAKKPQYLLWHTQPTIGNERAPKEVFNKTKLLERPEPIRLGKFFFWCEFSKILHSSCSKWSRGGARGTLSWDTV